MRCIYGGTFDPVHYGHLRTALEVQQALGVAQVHLLPCALPPHRDEPRVSPDQRLQLLRLAIADQPALAIDDRELQRGGRSYMVDTLRSLREEVGEDAPVCLILGMDAFLGLESWHQWQSLTELAHLLVMQRPGSEWPATGALAELVGRARVEESIALSERPAGLLYGLQVTPLGISSTQIRTLLAAKRSPRYLLPDSVLQHITEYNWYRN